MSKVSIDQLTFDILCENNLPNDFSCGLQSLDDFLCTKALPSFEEGLETWVATYKEDVVGFFSVCDYEVCLSVESLYGLQSKPVQKEIILIPALHISNIAVKNTMHRRGVGRNMVNFAEYIAKQRVLDRNLPYQCLCTDTIREAFYARCGFTRLFSGDYTNNTHYGNEGVVPMYRFV